MKSIALLALAAIPARAFADLNFDATTVAPDTGLDVMPVGWYNATIDESEMKPTKDGTGAFLKLRFNIVDGQYAGRKVFTQLNLKNSNAQTVEIAQKQLSAICHAVNVLRPGKSEELHGIPLKIKLKLTKATDEYEARNEISSYKNVNEQVDMAGGDSAASAAGAAAFGAGAPAQPWAQGAAASVAGSLPASEAPPAQPWANPGAAAPAADNPPPAAPPAAPPPPTAEAPAHDPMAAAIADGWIQHPSSPPHMYKGQEVKSRDEVKAMYPAPAAPAAPAAPPPPPAAPAAPDGDPAAAQAAPPPWAAPKS